MSELRALRWECVTLCQNRVSLGAETESCAHGGRDPGRPGHRELRYNLFFPLDFSFSVVFQ